MPDETTTSPNPEEPPKILTATSARFVDGPHFYSFYCNNVGFGVNQLDVVLLLNEILEVKQTGEAIVERRARVTMNPIQAKALRQMLDQVIALYEAQNGRVPDALTGYMPVSASAQ